MHTRFPQRWIVISFRNPLFFRELRTTAPRASRFRATRGLAGGALVRPCPSLSSLSCGNPRSTTPVERRRLPPGDSPAQGPRAGFPQPPGGEKDPHRGAAGVRGRERGRSRKGSQPGPGVSGNGVRSAPGTPPGFPRGRRRRTRLLPPPPGGSVREEVQPGGRTGVPPLFRAHRDHGALARAPVPAVRGRAVAGRFRPEPGLREDQSRSSVAEPLPVASRSPGAGFPSSPFFRAGATWSRRW